MAENWSWARDVNGRDRDETETSVSRDRDVDNFSRDETETRRWYVSRPSRDRDVETETTTLVISAVCGESSPNFRGIYGTRLSGNVVVKPPYTTSFRKNKPTNLWRPFSNLTHFRTYDKEFPSGDLRGWRSKKRKKEQIKHEHALNHRRQHSSYKGFDFVDSLKSVKRNTSLAKTTSCFAADLKAADIYVSFCNSLSAVLIFYASTSDWPPEAFCCGVVLVRESECVCACARDSLWTRFLTNRLWEFFPNVQFGVTGGSILHSNWKAVRGCCKNKMVQFSWLTWVVSRNIWLRWYSQISSSLSSFMLIHVNHCYYNKKQQLLLLVGLVQ